MPSNTDFAAENTWKVKRKRLLSLFLPATSFLPSCKVGLKEEEEEN